MLKNNFIKIKNKFILKENVYLWTKKIFENYFSQNIQINCKEMGYNFLNTTEFDIIIPNFIENN